MVLLCCSTGFVWMRIYEESLIITSLDGIANLHVSGRNYKTAHQWMESLSCKSLHRRHLRRPAELLFIRWTAMQLILNDGQIAPDHSNALSSDDPVQFECKSRQHETSLSRPL